MRARFLLAVLLVAAALAPGATARSQDEDALRPVLSDVRAAYGSEAWKDVNATIGKATAGSPAPAVPGAEETGVYKNPYSQPDHAHQPPASTSLGYRLETNITLRTSDGGSPPSDKNYFIDAWLESAAGQVPARLSKLTNDTFQVLADLDGENAHGYPALTLGGQARLQVKVYEDPADPTVEPQVVASTRYLLDVRDGRHQARTAIFPEAQAPGYDDVGATNYTRLRSGVVHPDTRVDATVRFPGADEQPVVAHLYRGTMRVPVFTGETGPNGTVSFSFTPREALPETDSSGLLVLEAHLKGSRRVLGSAPTLLAVTPHPMTVTSIQHEDRSGPQGTSTVQVTVRDSNDNLQNNSRRGTLYLVKGTDVVTETSFGAGTSADPAVRTARFPASAVTEPGYTDYNLVALFFDDQDDFYSLATARRGASVALETPDPVEPNTETHVVVTVRNENDNGNARADPGLSLTAELRIRNLPGAGSVVQDEVIVDEGAAGVAEIPFTPTETGTHDFAVNVTAGEIQLNLVGAVEVREKTLLDEVLSEDDLLGTPAPGGTAAFAALAAVALALRRRRGD